MYKFIVCMNFALFTARLRSILQQYKQEYVSITSSHTLSTGRHDALIIVTRLVNDNDSKHTKGNKILRSEEDRLTEPHWSPHLKYKKLL